MRDGEESSVAAHVAELVSRGLSAQAAAVCAAIGDHARASTILEDACDFAGGAKEALLAEDLPRAARLAALSGNDALWSEVERALDGAPRDVALRTARDLAARDFSRQAGGLLARLGEHLEAAQTFAAGHEAIRAASSFELAGRPADGARTLEAALRARPTFAAARLELGRLLARHGRTEAAVKALQQLESPSPERDRALPLLGRCLAELGLEDAARSVREEIARRKIVDDGSDRASAPAPAQAAGAAATLMFGRYEVIREVAVTPHARVIEATDRLTGEPVAVKVLAGSMEGAGRDALLRFEREAKALGALRHPNAVPLRAYLPEGPALVLAWMAGGSLADLMRREPVAPARAVEIACAVLDALGEAHRLGILHRDVKPSNVLFDEVGTARLSDFGAAHLGDLSTTATAGAIGTFSYMSPEQRLGKAATVASDLYAVGALLIELLTGEPAEPAHDGHLTRAPSECHPDLLPAHDAAVARLIEENATRRPEDAFEARRALSALKWSDRVPERRADAPRPTTDRPPASGRAQRLTAPRDRDDSRDLPARRHDAWLGRDVLVVPLDEPALERARAFARSGHAALATVLRVDPVAGEIWIDPPRGRALHDEARGLTPGQRARLEEAIRALHAAGGAHGDIDGDHLYWHDGEVVLAYPRRPARDGDAARDLEALARL